jgi:hypothetical protein
MTPQEQADLVTAWRSYATPERYYWRSGSGRIG